MNHPQKGHIAFWSYDCFPHVLSGTVVSLEVKGTEIHVLTKEYGAGYRFRALAVMPPEQGKPIADALQALKAEHRAATRQLQREFTAKLLKAAPFMKEHL